jgi:hypothetical protein
MAVLKEWVLKITSNQLSKYMVLESRSRPNEHDQGCEEAFQIFVCV